MGLFLNLEPNLNLLWFTRLCVSINKQTVRMAIQTADEIRGNKGNLQYSDTSL